MMKDEIDFIDRDILFGNIIFMTFEVKRELR